MSQGTWCPYCANRKIIPGYNDLLTTNPELENLWSKDNVIDPHTVSKGSHKKTLWVCERGHEWISRIYSVVSGTRCSVCSGNIINESNSIYITHPEIVGEWDYSNNSKTPKEVSSGSDYRAWWICSIDNSHKWQTKVSHRLDVKIRSGCPKCSRRVSKGQKEFTDYIKSILPDEKVEVDYKGLCRGKLEVDVYIPGISVAFEYNGVYWHSSIEGSINNMSSEKVDQCYEKGIDLFVIFDDEWQCNKEAVKNRVRILIEGIQSMYSEVELSIEPEKVFEHQIGDIDHITVDIFSTSRRLLEGSGWQILSHTIVFSEVYRNVRTKNYSYNIFNAGTRYIEDKYLQTYYRIRG